MLRQRIITAVGLLAALLAVLFLLPRAVWPWLALAVVALAAWEWGRLAGLGVAGAAGYCGFIVASAVALMAAGALGGGADAAPLLILALGFWLVVAPLWLARRWSLRGLLLGGTVGWIVLVPAWLAAARLGAEPAVLLAVMALVWIADSAAYFAGRRFGRRKLAPAVSPGKTWEGVYGALAATSVYGVAAVCLVGVAGDAGRGRIMCAVIGLAGAAVLTAASIVGDLLESLLKRQAGAKDSGSVLPGHGGVLDRIDAMLPVLPLFAAMAWMAEGTAAG